MSALADYEAGLAVTNMPADLSVLSEDDLTGLLDSAQAVAALTGSRVIEPLRRIDAERSVRRLRRSEQRIADRNRAAVRFYGFCKGVLGASIVTGGPIDLIRDALAEANAVWDAADAELKAGEPS